MFIVLGGLVVGSAMFYPLLESDPTMAPVMCVRNALIAVAAWSVIVVCIARGDS